MSPALTRLQTLWDEYTTPPKNTKRDAIVWGWFNAGDLVLLAGPANKGKSTALTDLAVSVATGSRWLGLIHSSRRPVIYLDAENPPHYAQEALTAACKARGVSIGDQYPMLRVIGKDVIARKTFDADEVSSLLSVASI